MNLIKSGTLSGLFSFITLFSKPFDCPAQIDWPQLKFTEIAGGASVPTSIAAAGDGSGRLFLTEQNGRVMLVQSNSVVPFLDIEDRVQYPIFTEYGLLSVAFPPGFATNRQFYVYYNREPDGASTISRFLVSANNSNVADPTTEQVLLVVPLGSGLAYTVSGGLLLFGPDGFLYAGMGDTGFAANSPNQAQNRQSLRGKILRLDVQTSTNGYQIPGNNPFVGNTNYLPEIWALGLRNPWRFAFDRGTGDFYVADVGQIEAEEVNFKPAVDTAGQNYGWPTREGRRWYAGPVSLANSFSDPIVEIPHTDPPNSLTGGFVFRGSGSARMTGVYFSADAFTGKVWGLKRVGTNWNNQLLANVPYFISTFGEDETGQLYVADYNSGSIYRMEDNGMVAPATFNPPGTNSFTETVTLGCLSTSAAIHYTTNGIDPEMSDPFVNPGGAVTVGAGTILKARAFRNDLLPSPITRATYNLKAARPTFNPPVGPVTNGQLIAIGCLTPGATIRYTLDGTDPTSGSPPYSTSIAYNPISSLKARAFKTGFADSAVAIFTLSAPLIQKLIVSQRGAYASFECASQPDWFYQMQISDNPGQWLDLDRAQAGTNGVLLFQSNNGYPVPLRRFFRIRAEPDLSL